MNVYDITDTDSLNVLLTGDIDFVLEFAGIMKRNGVSFAILPSIEARDSYEYEMEMEFELSALGGPSAEEYGEFASHVIDDIRENVNTYSHIVDLSITTHTDHRVAVEVAASVNPRATVMASVLNTTATEFGMFTNTAQRVVGVGLAPSVMSTLTTMDMSAGLNTDPHHVEQAKELLRRLGYSIEVVQDRVGLVQMRVLAMLINEAAFAVMEGLATPEDIDKAMMLGVNYPKGLLAWADEIGIGIVTLILDGLRREYEQERYRPCVLLKQMMRAGWAGKSTGRGFYVYES
jgi:3-hydroxybutyryl-CoA dehydrogenase